jgi:hypothetical protein
MVRIYVTKQIGSGVSRADAIRSKANDYVDIGAGDRFWEYDHPARRYSFIICSALNTTHTAMQADPDIHVFSELYDDFIDAKTGIDVQVSTLSPIIQAAIQDRLDLLQINYNWVTGTTTLRQIYTYVMRVFTLAQWANGKKDTDFLDALRENLDTEAQDVPAGPRARITSWMDEKNLDRTWVTPTTTIREIFHHFIVMNATFLNVRVAGEVF